jgi:hypothetical protein
VKAPGKRRTRRKRRKGAETTREGPSEVASHHESDPTSCGRSDPEIFVFSHSECRASFNLGQA